MAMGELPDTEHIYTALKKSPERDSTDFSCPAMPAEDGTRMSTSNDYFVPHPRGPDVKPDEVVYMNVSLDYQEVN